MHSFICVNLINAMFYLFYSFILGISTTQLAAIMSKSGLKNKSAGKTYALLNQCFGHHLLWNPRFRQLLVIIPGRRDGQHTNDKTDVVTSQNYDDDPGI